MKNYLIYILLKDTITFILTTTGLIIAGMGLSTWRKQIKGSKEFKTSYNLNYSLLRLRNAIKYVRHPAIWPSEQYKATQYFKDKYPEKLGVDEEKNPSDGYVYEMRWEKIIHAYEKMEVHLLEAEVLWGSEILEKIKPLKKKVNELNIMLKQNFAPPNLRGHSPKEIREIIYDMSSEEKEDKFSEGINSDIKEIADYIKQKTK
jgi:hypothetical protein